MAGKTGRQTEYWIRYISSFAGIAPAEARSDLCIVVIHKPEKKIGYYGNVVAAPVFKKIAQKIYSDTAIEDRLKEIEISQLESKNEIYITSDEDRSVMPQCYKIKFIGCYCSIRKPRVRC